jgi:hypothetical protein
MNTIVDIEKDDLFSLMAAITCPLTNCNKGCSNYQFCINPINQFKIRLIKSNNTDANN